MRSDSLRKKLFPVFLLPVIIMLVSCSDKTPPNIVNAPEDVQWKKIGALTGTAAAHYMGEYGEPFIYASQEAMLADLRAGVTDCVVGDATSVGSFTKSGRWVRILDEPLFSYEFSFAIAKENADLTAVVDAALLSLDNEGTLAAIRDGYLQNTGYRYAPQDGDFEYTLVLGIKSDFPPYAFADGNTYSGIDIDICRAICDTIGVELEIKEFPNDDLITMIRYGKVDLAAGGLYKTDENSDLVDFSTSYAVCEQVILVRK